MKNMITRRDFIKKLFTFGAVSAVATMPLLACSENKPQQKLDVSLSVKPVRTGVKK